MKKVIVLFLLFVVPIVAYLFFASGVNSFMNLPTLKKEVPEFGPWESLSGESVKLSGKITVLGFGGSDIWKVRGNLYNLNQKIYNRYHDFNDLQFVYLCPIEAKADAQKIYDELSQVTDMKDWKFVFAPSAEIQKFHAGLNVRQKLGTDSGTTFVYFLDKNRNLRGRKDDKQFMDGYDTFHPSIMSNEMLDDFKVLIYEYKAALRKNNNAEKRLKGL